MCKCSETPEAGEQQPCPCQRKKRGLFVTVLLIALPLGTLVAAAYWLYRQNKLKLPTGNG